MSNRAVLHPKKTLPSLAIGVALCASLVVVPGRTVRTAAVSILEPVATAPAGAMAAQAASPATVRSRAVRVNLYPLPTPGTAARSQEDDLELALFPDVVVTAVFERFETIRGSGTWVGKLKDMPLSSVTLAYRDGLLSAEIHTGRASYAIRPVPEEERSADDATRQLHVVEEIDVSRLMRGDDVVHVPLESPAATVTASAAPADTGDVIDVMVVFTPAAEARLGGPGVINNQIALAIASTNAAYASSGVSQRIRLVHTALVPFTETASSGADLNAIAASANVRSLRDQMGADLVSLVYYHPNTDVCGKAALSTNGFTVNAASGYGVVSAVCLIGRTLGHELGHNMGLLHDWHDGAIGGTWSLDWPMPFARGHVDLANRWITIMSYTTLCASQGVSCAGVNYFSNPDVEHDPVCADGTINCDLFKYWFFPRPRGFVGVPADGPTNCRPDVVPAAPCRADNRRALNQTARLVANYRPSR